MATGGRDGEIPRGGSGVGARTGGREKKGTTDGYGKRLTGSTSIIGKLMGVTDVLQTNKHQLLGGGNLEGM